MPLFMTPREVAERWHCSPRHVRRLAERGGLPGLRVGGLWRISVAAVEAFEQGHTTDATPDVALRREKSREGVTTSVDGFSLPADYEPAFPDLWPLHETKKSASQGR